MDQRLAKRCFRWLNRDINLWEGSFSLHTNVTWVLERSCCTSATIDLIQKVLYPNSKHAVCREITWPLLSKLIASGALFLSRSLKCVTVIQKRHTWFSEQHTEQVGSINLFGRVSNVLQIKKHTVRMILQVNNNNISMMMVILRLWTSQIKHLCRSVANRIIRNCFFFSVYMTPEGNLF